MADINKNITGISNSSYQDAENLLLKALQYWHGKNVKQDKALAFSLCRQSAEMGHPEAMYTLGVFLLDMNQSKLADAWIRKAADAGSKQAFSFLKKTESVKTEQRSKVPVMKSAPHKKSCRKTSSNTDELIDFFESGDYEIYPQGAVEEKRDTLQNYALQDNNISAMRILYQLYDSGISVERNPNKAARWLNKMLNSISEGNYTVTSSETEEYAVSAVYSLAGNHCMETGKFSDAVLYYQKGAELGDPVSLRRLGENYYFGKGVESDHAAALDCLLQYLHCYDDGTETPLASAFYLIGLIYGEDQEDYQNALRYLCRGAKLEDDPASSLCQYEAAMYFFLQDDDRQSYQYLMKAADSGDMDALIEAGIRSQFGYGGFRKSLGDAVQYYQLAIEAGTDDAKPYVGLCSIMSSVENPYSDMEQAIEYGEYALQNCEFYDKDDIDVYIYLASAYHYLEHFDHALAYAEKAKEYGLDYAEECYQSILKDKRFSTVFGFVDSFMNSPIAAAIPNVNIIAVGWKIGRKIGDAWANKDVSGTLEGISDAMDYYEEFDEYEEMDEP